MVRIRKIKKMNKKAVSPVIATVLLVLIVIILAIIVLLWSRGFIKEVILKEIGGDSKRVEEFCSAGVSIKPILNEDMTFGFTNNGNVPIYAVNLKYSGIDSGSSFVDKIEQSGGGRVNPGVSTYLKNSDGDYYYYDDYSEVKIIPILLGETKTGAVKEFPCPDINGVVI